MKSITAIKEEFKNLTPEEISAQIVLYRNDERKGVQSFLLSQKKKVEKYYQEVERIENLCRFEKEYSQYEFICGIDEVGRGPLAGPVVAGAVVLPKESRILYINDSKKLSAKKREELFEVIQKEAVSVGIGMASPERIDEINILQATYEAMRQAVANLSVKPNLLLNDAVTIPGMDMKQVPIIKGDAKSISIGAASIMAKVYRDRMMEEYDHIFPGYDFASNKGYGSKEHIEAIHRQGPCPIHRRSFLKNICGSRFKGMEKAAVRRNYGMAAEEAAALFLEGKGIRILERNFRSYHGEIDIIALEKETILIVEVKMRRNKECGTPAEAVNLKKQKRICYTLNYYRMKKQLMDTTAVRFDVIEVDKDLQCHWIKNAFEFQE